ncbi:MAG: lipoate protein ligase C-terminal domain-containing protein [Candidatus Micrarchaeota archaeon]|nr:lipoate protein ligase C-terminal domain-containing protein [Candidatus Micrarchaeota archaeon]
MKSGKNIYKAGKLLKISLEYDNVIRQIKITGDFFLYPEEGIEQLQLQLIGAELTKEKLTDRINQILKIEKLEPFGFNSEQLAEAILGACKE